MVITLPSIATSSTVSVVNVPRLVIAVCAAPVTVAAVPEQLPVKLPVTAPTTVIPESLIVSLVVPSTLNSINPLLASDESAVVANVTLLSVFSPLS